MDTKAFYSFIVNVN